MCQEGNKGRIASNKMLPKREYFEVIYKRYGEASRKEKTVIIDECCAVCGYHRKHAIAQFVY